MTRKDETADLGANQAAATTTLSDQARPQCSTKSVSGQGSAPTEIDAIFKKVIAALPAGTKQYQGEDSSAISVQCPAHDDDRPSLSISKGRDTVALYCHAGCQTEAILAKLGLKFNDLYPNSSNGRRIVATYDYRDADGTILYQTVRYEPKDFRQRRPNGKGGWIWNMRGVKHIPYMLRGLLDSSPDDWIFVTEGEKSAQAIAMQPPHGLGLTATCNVGGARKWRDSYNQYLKGRRVAILPDNDGQGRDHANRVYQSLQGVAADVRIVNLPVSGLKEDPYDWVHKYNGTADELLRLVESALEIPSPGNVGATWQDMDSLIGPIEWEWQPWLSKGLLTLVAGEPGQGKSVLMLRIAATYLLGWDWPDSTPFGGETGGVLWCESEAAQAINLDRAKQWGLPLKRIYTPLDNPLDDVQLDKTEDQEAVERIAHRDDVRLIIVDSLRGAHRRDENSSVTMEVCKWLAELARDTGKPVLLSHHLRKRGMLDVSDRVTLDRIRGSSAIIQTARMVWAIDAPDLDYEDSKRLSVIKSNLARFPEPVGFTIGDEMRLTFGDAPEAPREETQMDKAIDLLRALLASGPMATVDLRDETDGAGISWPTVTRAKRKLGIVAKRNDNKWHWALPARPDDTPH